MTNRDLGRSGLSPCPGHDRGWGVRDERPGPEGARGRGERLARGRAPDEGDLVVVDHGIREELPAHLLRGPSRGLPVGLVEIDEEALRAVDPGDALEAEELQ